MGLLMNNTITTAALSLPVHITPHHLKLTPALRAFTLKKLTTLRRKTAGVLRADVVLRRHHGTAEGKRFSASARLAVPGRDLHAGVAHADLYTAIVKLVAKLARRSRKRKTRLAKTHYSKPDLPRERFRRTSIRTNVLDGGLIKEPDSWSKSSQHTMPPERHASRSAGASAWPRRDDLWPTRSAPFHATERRGAIASGNSSRGLRGTRGTRANVRCG
jgi:putative sigma-54 modulation protein